MQKLELKNISSVIDAYDLFLFDLWGVIVEGEKVYDGVVETINELISRGRKCIFVSNAPRPAASSLEKIKSWGIDVDVNQVFTSGEIARNIICDKYQAVFHLGKDRNKDILDNLKHLETQDINEADSALLSLYRDEGEDLTEFDDIINKIAKRNIPVICANPDVTIPNNGKTRYCAGYFAEILESLGSKVVYTGKPYLEIYELALARFIGLDKSRILMIGDTFETDILGANNVGIHSALVLSGNAKRFHKQAEIIEDKLLLLQEMATTLNVMPNFVINLS